MDRYRIVIERQSQPGDSDRPGDDIWRQDWFEAPSMVDAVLAVAFDAGCRGPMIDYWRKELSK